MLIWSYITEASGHAHACALTAVCCADDIKAGLTAHFVKSYDEILKLALLPEGLL